MSVEEFVFCGNKLLRFVEIIFFTEKTFADSKKLQTFSGEKGFCGSQKWEQFFIGEKLKL